MAVFAFTGDLGVDAGTPQSVYSLDTGRMKSAGAAMLAVGTPGSDVLRLPDGFTFTADGFAPWASFEVKRDPGKTATLGAAVLVVLGLVLSLRIRRRRVWVRTTPQPAENGSPRWLVEVGGLARVASPADAQEFARLTAGLQDALPVATAAEAPGGPAGRR